MIERDLPEITEEDLNLLIELSRLEDERIEYKEELNLKDESARRKFLASVASFANAAGGDLLFGMRAVDGRPVEIKPLTGVNSDALTLQLTASIRTGIEPIVYALEMRLIPVSGGEVLILRIQKSWAGPHLLTFGGDNRFYTRHKAGRVPMVLPEIRSAFAIAETVSEKVQKFRMTRMADILAGESPAQVSNRPALLFHIVPLKAFDPSFRADLSPVTAAAFHPNNGNSWGRRRNMDGAFIIESGEDPRGYIFAFQNGAVEILDGTFFGFHQNEKLIGGIAFERAIAPRAAKCVSRYLGERGKTPSNETSP
jgi:hypothetical protein